MTPFSWERSASVTGKHFRSRICVQGLINRALRGRFSLVKHPKLMEICKTKGIALEVCPISYVPVYCGCQHEPG